MSRHRRQQRKRARAGYQRWWLQMWRTVPSYRLAKLYGWEIWEAPPIAWIETPSHG